MVAKSLATDAPPVGLHALSVQKACQQNSGKTIERFEVGELAVEIRATSDAVWAFIRREGRGGLALRAAYLIGPFEWTKVLCEPGEAARLKLKSAAGEYLIVFGVGGWGGSTCE